MRLRYAPQARRDINAIAEYIAERNPAASKRVGDRIRQTAELLAGISFHRLEACGVLRNLLFLGSRTSSFIGSIRENKLS